MIFDCVLCFTYLSCVLYICIVFYISVLCFMYPFCVLHICVVFCMSVLCFAFVLCCVVLCMFALRFVFVGHRNYQCKETKKKSI